MNQVAFLLSPEQFPHNLFTKALTWAQEHQSAFKLIIITDETFSVEHTNAEPFTYEVDEVEPLSIDGHQINVIIHLVKYIRKKVIATGLNFSSTILVRPRIKDVLDEVRFAEMVFFEFQNAMDKSSFEWQELLRQIPMHKQAISNRVHG